MAGIALSDRVVDLDRRVVRLANRVVRLTAREVDLLAYLAERAGQVVPLDELHREVWGHHPNVVSRAAYHTWRRLLPKLERAPSVPAHLHLVHGEGLLLRRAEPGREHGPPLVGRERELEQLAALAAAHPWVVLLGPGGIGKTHLARAFLGAEAAWCDAGSCRSREDLVAALAASVGLLPGADEDVVRERCRARGRVGLDSVEQAVPAARALCERWAADGVGALVLTSQVSLGAGAELAVPGLPPDAARALLARHANLNVDTPGLTELVDLLDGLPLAVQLAAGRARILPLHSLREALHTRRLALLRDPTAGGRHASLEAVLEQSWQLLRPVQRRALARLARLPDAFTAEEVEPVLADLDVWSVDLLQQLAATSWVHPSSARWRFRLLESQRAYALASCTPEEAADADRHVVDGLLRPARHGSGGHLLEAVRIATRRGWHEQAARAWLAALEIHRHRDPRALAELGAALATDLLPAELRRRVELERVHELLRANRAADALARILAVPDAEADASALLTRGQARHAAGDAAAAEADLRSARALAQGQRQPALATAAAVSLAASLRVQGRWDEAHRLYEALLDELDPEEEPDTTAAIGNGLALIAKRRGQHARARDLLETASATTTDVAQGAVYGLNLVQLHLDTEDLDAAAAALDALAPTLEAVGSRVLLARVDALRGECDACRGRTERARLALRRALTVFREAGNARPAAWLLAVLALLEAEIGHRERSLALSAEAWQTADGACGPEATARIAYRLARAARLCDVDPAPWVARGDAVLPAPLPLTVARERARATGASDDP